MTTKIIEIKELQNSAIGMRITDKQIVIADIVKSPLSGFEQTGQSAISLILKNRNFTDTLRAL
jgi:hypothetical protein